MDNRFKFRAWNTDERVMRYDIENGYYDPDWTDAQGAHLDFNDIINNDEIFVIMQCTGLADKTGKLIYEGDIVTCNDNPLKGVIEWHYRELHFQCGWNNKLGAGDIYYLVRDCELEVIGNIYENPELLKKVKDNE